MTTPASEQSDAPGRLLATPDATRRRALPAFRGNLGVTSGFLLAALGVLAFTWWALWSYAASVAVTGGGRTVIRTVAILLGVLAVAVPAYGVRGFARALRARAAAGRGDLARARVLAEDARDAIDAVLDAGFHLNAYVGDDLYVAELNAEAKRYAAFQHIPVTAVGDPNQAIYGWRGHGHGLDL